MIYRRSEQVVEGESAIFNKLETLMRRDAAILRKARRPELVHGPLVCATVHCERVRMAESRYCAKCAEESQALDAWAARQRDPEPREGWVTRFVHVFLFVLAVEGLLDFAFSFAGAWSWLLFEIGWAALVGAVVAWVAAEKGRR